VLSSIEEVRRDIISRLCTTETKAFHFSILPLAAPEEGTRKPPPSSSLYTMVVGWNDTIASMYHETVLYRATAAMLCEIYYIQLCICVFVAASILQLSACSVESAYVFRTAGSFVCRTACGRKKKCNWRRSILVPFCVDHAPTITTIYSSSHFALHGYGRAQFSTGKDRVHGAR
jgi:hypothetical protein